MFGLKHLNTVIFLPEYIQDVESYCIEGAEAHYFSGMDRYEDFLRLKIHLNKNKLYFDRQYAFYFCTER